jgi:hypothetical protein
MLLRKEQGGSSIGPYRWENDGDVVEVDEKTGHDLLRIKAGGFSVPEPDPEPEPDPKTPAAPAKPAAAATKKATAASATPTLADAAK